MGYKRVHKIVENIVKKVMWKTSWKVMWKVKTEVSKAIRTAPRHNPRSATPSALCITYTRPYILHTFSSRFVINPYPTYVFFSVCEKTDNISSPRAAYAAWARRRRGELVKIEVSRANNRRGIRPHRTAPHRTT